MKEASKSLALLSLIKLVELGGDLISFDRLVMTYKIINKLSPESLWDKFELRSVHSKCETRNCHDLELPRLNAERAKMALNTRLYNYGMICLLIYERPQLSNASKSNFKHIYWLIKNNN